MVATKTPFSIILSWLLSEIYTSIDENFSKKLLKIASQINPSHRKCFVIMFEFFHDGSKRIDPSFYIMPEFDNFDQKILPSYWKDYKEVSLMLTKNSSKKHEEMKINFPCRDIFEFDCHEYDYKLAGIFYYLGQASIIETQDTINIMQSFISLYDCSFFQKEFHSSFLNLIYLLKTPDWIGIMNRSQAKFKFIYSSSINTTILNNFFDTLDLNHSFYRFKDKILSLDQRLYRLCLDYDFKNNSIDERICLEFSPKNPAQECRSWKLLDELAALFDLNSDTISDIKKVHGRLPYGIKSKSIFALESLKPLQAQSIVALISHYKLAFYLDKPCTIKSYMQACVNTFA